MKRWPSLVLMALLVAASSNKATGEIDACAFVTKAEAAVVIGEMKGEPAAKAGLRGRKCSYEDVKGAWLTIEVYAAEVHWELMKNMALDAQEISGLGDGAFSARRGDTRQVYVKKGALMIEVDSSDGLHAARTFATIAARRLP